jgi:hypothetical protein
MITGARIAALNQPAQDPARQPSSYGWITALRPRLHPQAHRRWRPAPAQPVRRGGSGRDHLSGFPGERLIACRNPVLAADRARKREDLIAATEKLLAPIAAASLPGGLTALRRSASRSARSTNTRPKPLRRRDHRTSLTVPAGTRRSMRKPPWTGCTPPAPRARRRTGQLGAVTAYRNLKHVERHFPRSRPAIWNCARSSTGWRNASGPTC